MDVISNIVSLVKDDPVSRRYYVVFLVPTAITCIMSGLLESQADWFSKFDPFDKTTGAIAGLLVILAPSFAIYRYIDHAESERSAREREGLLTIAKADPQFSLRNSLKDNWTWRASIDENENYMTGDAQLALNERDLTLQGIINVDPTEKFPDGTAFNARETHLGNNSLVYFWNFPDKTAGSGRLQLFIDAGSGRLQLFTDKEGKVNKMNGYWWVNGQAGEGQVQFNRASKED